MKKKKFFSVILLTFIFSMFLSSCGDIKTVNPAYPLPAEYDKSLGLTYRQALYLACSFCEYSGYEIITESRLQIDDELLLRAVSAGLCEYGAADYDSLRDCAVTRDEFSRICFKLIKTLSREQYAKSSDRVSEADMLALLTLGCKICGIDEPFSVSELAESDKTAEISLGDMCETLCYAVKLNADANSDYAELAFSSEIIGAFPQSGSGIDADFVLTFDKLIDFTCDFCTRSPLSESEKPLTAGNACGMLDAVYEYLQAFAVCGEDAETKDNRSFSEIYFSQQNSGECSDFNCMAAVAAMAIKRSDPLSIKTPVQLRNDYYSDGDGWTLDELCSCLTDNNVPHRRERGGLETILSCLDDGCAVVARFSETDISAVGHCMLIYGVQRRGNQIFFLAYDPLRLPYSGVYGSLSDNTLKIEARYAAYLIHRVSSEIIVLE